MYFAKTPITDRFCPRPQDVVIAVMGVTGAGKSTFISHLTTENVGIGHGLEGCKYLEFISLGSKFAEEL